MEQQLTLTSWFRPFPSTACWAITSPAPNRTSAVIHWVIIGRLSRLALRKEKKVFFEFYNWWESWRCGWQLMEGGVGGGETTHILVCSNKMSHWRRDTLVVDGDFQSSPPTLTRLTWKFVKTRDFGNVPLNSGHRPTSLVQTSFQDIHFWNELVSRLTFIVYRLSILACPSGSSQNWSHTLATLPHYWNTWSSTRTKNFSRKEAHRKIQCFPGTRSTHSIYNISFVRRPSKQSHIPLSRILHSLSIWPINLPWQQKWLTNSRYYHTLFSRLIIKPFSHCDTI